ncbi:UDP-glucose dehydrogenase family protein [Aurantimicrobium photophilum]|uniref:UDP-glucose 6-dehydrogenase n=1 Tax=Aurantimicrobium photophilum TaxID=1987356 RepID=A0A2Z3RVJ0_9MICO|nr:UDP-glucose/GDP-mannose dehydrogenase family protein [Aurantimicrobium photophilum]AWR20925.1 UDP-glucose 6-dehydrogenase TuaD [Aurantimicrobium photophilum]
MRVSVIGCGYLGAVHAAAMADLGHEVIAVDVDAEKVAALSTGTPPFFEPGLPEILSSSLASGRLRFTTDIAEVAGCELHFIAVGTPQSDDSGAADIRFVDAAVDALLPNLGPEDVVVGKSTVPVGTAQRLAEKLLSAGSSATLVWNPEFLREGFAVKDTLSPDRLVFGVADGVGQDRALAAVREVYAAAIDAGTPVVETDRATAELVKTAANAFLATKISFINAMSEIAEATGANVTELADAIGYDTRIGRRFLNAGVGFGGGCLPKDIRAFSARAEELGLGSSVAFLGEVDAINLRQRQRVIDRVISDGGGDPVDLKVAVLGLAFKPQSDDVRDSPALDVARGLAEAGALVTAYDPEAMGPAQKRFPELKVASTLQQALLDADIAVLVTEWPEFVQLDPRTAGDLMAHKRIVDARNVLDPAAWRAAGFHFSSLGRP